MLDLIHEHDSHFSTTPRRTRSGISDGEVDGSCPSTEVVCTRGVVNLRAAVGAAHHSFSLMDGTSASLPSFLVIPPISTLGSREQPTFLPVNRGEMRVLSNFLVYRKLPELTMCQQQILRDVAAAYSIPELGVALGLPSRPSGQIWCSRTTRSYGGSGSMS